jgi:ferric-dicitrate binding protein FerR (iron transport regulator)
MSLDRVQTELLLRFLDGAVTQAEQRQVEAWLQADAEVRAFLREVAEQAVMIGDVERTAISCQEALLAPGSGGSRRQPGVPQPAGSWLTMTRVWRVALAVSISALLTMSAFAYWATSRPSVALVTDVSGASQYFSSTGRSEHAVQTGMTVVAGDTLESRSCDASITLVLLDATTLTMAGQTAIRVLRPEQELQRFDLPHGSLWVSPSRASGHQRLSVRTPAAVVQAGGAQFSVQTSQAESIVRVNHGVALVTTLRDGRTIAVPADYQVQVSLAGSDACQAVPQPHPVGTWTCSLLKGPEVSLGQWLAPTESAAMRLAAAPLLWPIPDRDPVLLHVVAIAVWKNSERPVLLKDGSRIQFRGRIDRPQAVRFGFVAQKMRGVFAGKFELDVSPKELGPAGETWQVELPLSRFRPLASQWATAPEGLELTDLYALTIAADAGLEINHVELLPPEAAVDSGLGGSPAAVHSPR